MEEYKEILVPSLNTIIQDITNRFLSRNRAQYHNNKVTGVDIAHWDEDSHSFVLNKSTSPNRKMLQVIKIILTEREGVAGQVIT